MAINRVCWRVMLAAAGLFISTGCQSIERAPVSFSYAVEAERGLPPGMTVLTVMPAKLGPTTDAKWSDLCATTIQQLINESRNRLGTAVTVSDRRDTQVTFDEADLEAAGMSTKRGGSGGKLLAAQGAILSNINVKVEKHIGRQRTISGIDIGAFKGRDYYGRRTRGGHGAIETQEIETVTRTMTVQIDFRLIDTSNNQVWVQSEPVTYTGTDRTRASAFFGSSRTEAELTPQDRIILGLVERAARQFVSRIMPCRIDVRAVVVSSGHADCIEGTRLLRGELYDEAVFRFQAALAADSSDHRAAYGAGVACEASGRYDDALRYYRRANAGADREDYREALDRVKNYGHRVRG